MKTKTIFREEEYVTIRSRCEVSASRLGHYLAGLNARSLPIYWDLLYKIFVLGQGNPTREYRYRLADSIPSTLDRLEAANAYTRIMPFINVDVYNAIPAECVDVEPDGSFSVNISKVNDYATKMSTYELSENDLQIIEAYNKAFASSKIAPLCLAQCAGLIDGIVQINLHTYAKFIGIRPIGTKKVK